MIEYLPDGRVTVTFEDGEVYALRRPRFSEWRTFRQEIQKATDHARDQLADRAQAVRDLGAELATAGPEERPALEEAAESASRDLADFAARPFYEVTSEIVRAMFEALGDRPLPEDEGEWPVYLAADVTLPGQILAHWQKAPLASGARPADVR